MQSGICYAFKCGAIKADARTSGAHCAGANALVGPICQRTRWSLGMRPHPTLGRNELPQSHDMGKKIKDKKQGAFTVTTNAAILARDWDQTAVY